MKIRSWWRSIFSKSVPEPILDEMHIMLMTQSTDRLMQLRRCEAKNAVYAARIEELETQLMYANDAAAKGALARHEAGGMEMQISEQAEELARVRLSARLWDGLIGCARMTWLGHTGFLKLDERGYLHIGMNFWNIHEHGGDTDARVLLIRFAEDCAQRRELESKPEVAETTVLPGSPASA